MFQNCLQTKGLVTILGSTDFQVAHETLPHYWSSYDGVLPVDMPKCGFDGGLCDYTIFFAIGAAVLFISIVTPLSYFIYIKEYVHIVLF